MTEKYNLMRQYNIDINERKMYNVNLSIQLK